MYTVIKYLIFSHLKCRSIYIRPKLSTKIVKISAPQGVLCGNWILTAVTSACFVTQHRDTSTLNLCSIFFFSFWSVNNFFPLWSYNDQYFLLIYTSIYADIVTSGRDLPCCHFPEDKVWTLVYHNATDPVRVHGSTSEKPHTEHFDYGASPDQLRALVSQSEYCQQTLTYRCRRSRLFNTWGESSLLLQRSDQLQLATNEPVNKRIQLPCLTLVLTLWFFSQINSGFYYLNNKLIIHEGLDYMLSPSRKSRRS